MLVWFSLYTTARVILYLSYIIVSLNVLVDNFQAVITTCQFSITILLCGQCTPKGQTTKTRLLIRF